MLGERRRSASSCAPGTRRRRPCRVGRLRCPCARQSRRSRGASRWSFPRSELPILTHTSGGGTPAPCARAGQRAREEPAVGVDEAPGLLIVAAHADARRGDDARGGRACPSVPARGRIASGGSHTGRPFCSRPMPRACASRAGPLQSRRGSATPRRATISLTPLFRSDGSQKNACARALRFAGDVGAEVHAVGEVHVQVPGRSEEHGVSRRLAAVPVAARVVLAIGLGLDDATADPPKEKRAADEVARDLEGGAGEVALWKGRLRATPLEDDRESASCSAPCRCRRR